MKKMIFQLSIVLALILSGSGWTQNARMRQAPNAGRYFYATNLNLTADQMTKLNELRSAFYNETADLRNQVQSKTLQLRSLMLDPQKNRSEITPVQRELLTLRQKLQEKALTMQIKARKLLTPEQLALLPRGSALGIGLGLGFGAGRGYGLGICQAGLGYSPKANPAMGYARSRNGFMRGSRGAGRGHGWRSANCPYRY